MAVEAPATTLLTLIDSARSRGLGGAGAAFAGDPALIWINPASAGTRDVTATLGGQRGYIGDTALQLLCAVPVMSRLSAVAAFAYYDAGLTTDSQGRTISAQQDVLGDIGMSGRVADWLDAGVSLKAMRSELADAFVAKVAAVDAGLRAGYGPAAVSFGVTDGGARATYQGSAAPISTAWRSGAVIELAGDEEGPLPRLMRIAADAVMPLRGAAVEWHGGVEAVWRQGATLRTGMMRSGLPARWAGTLGCGIVAGRFRLDYASVLGSSAGAPQIVCLTIQLTRSGASGGDVSPAGALPVEGDGREEEPGR